MAKKDAESAADVVPKIFDPDTSFKELYDRIISNTGLIFVDTPEETRVIRSVIKKFKGSKIEYWSASNGLVSVPDDVAPHKFWPHSIGPDKARSSKGGSTRASPVNVFDCIADDARAKIEAVKAMGQEIAKNIYILRDLTVFLGQPGILRNLRDIIYLASSAASVIIVTGYSITVPNDLGKDSIYIKINYPTKGEIANDLLPGIKKSIVNFNKKVPEADRINGEFDENQVATACVGLTEDEVLNVLSHSTTIYKKIDIDLINDAKKSIINKSDILDYWICKDTLNDIGGFDELKEWFEVRKIVMNSPFAGDFKAKPPKGIMLLGMQGSGKSAIAKAVAQSWGVGLIKLEMGKVFAGLVGESISPDTEIHLNTANGITRIKIEDAYNKREELLTQFPEVLSFTRDGTSEYKSVTNIIKHIRTKNLVRVITKSGRSVDVTEDHSLFTISDQGKLIEMEPKNMVPGTIIAVPINSEDRAGLTTINIFSIMPREERSKWLLIDPTLIIGAKVFDVTPSKSHHQYRNGRPLNLNLLDDKDIDIAEKKEAKIKAFITETEHPVHIKISNDVLELFGWYTAEGSTTADRLRLHIHEDETKVVEDLIHKCGYDCYHYQDRDSHGVTIFFGETGLKRIFDYLGLTDKTRIPEWMEELSNHQIRCYLKGLFSGNGGISGEHIELSQAKPLLVKDVINLLANVGIFASIYPRIDGGDRIIIHSSVFKKKFMNEIGFTQEVKQELLEDLFGEDDWGHKVPFFKTLKDKDSAHSVDMNSSWISYKNAVKLDSSVEGWDVYWDTVRSIETLEEQPEFVYDISVQDNENFIAGNIICHNSEKRMRQALTQMEAVGGVIVVDEIDKGLSGAGSSDKTDGGTTSRVIGTLLTWLQEDHPSVFLIATANDITALRRNHPELLRKGRFDEIWFSDVPTEAERREIFNIHLRKNGRDPSRIDVEALAKVYYNDPSSGSKFKYTGAEIEYAIQDAIQEAFGAGKGKKLEINSKDDITTELIESKLSIIKPVSFICKEKIEPMRKWSALNARNVSRSKEEIAQTKKDKDNIKVVDMRSDEVDI